MVRATAASVLALMGATGALAAPRPVSRTLVSRDGEIVPIMPDFEDFDPVVPEVFVDPVTGESVEVDVPAMPIAGILSRRDGSGGTTQHEAFQDADFSAKPYPIGASFAETGGDAAPAHDKNTPAGKGQPPFDAQALPPSDEKGAPFPPFSPEAGAGGKDSFPPFPSFPLAGAGGKGQPPFDAQTLSQSGEKGSPFAPFPPEAGAGGRGDDGKAFPPASGDGKEPQFAAFPPAGGAGGKAGFLEDLSDGEEDGLGAGEDAKTPGADGAGGAPGEDGKPGEALPPFGDEKPAEAGEPGELGKAPTADAGEAPAPEAGEPGEPGEAPPAETGEPGESGEAPPAEAGEPGESSEAPPAEAGEVSAPEGDEKPAEDEAPAEGESPAEDNHAPVFDDPELATKIDKNAPGFQNVGTGEGRQFITGQCISDSDCESGCCAGLNGMGVCSGMLTAFEEGKTGCHFKL